MTEKAVFMVAALALCRSLLAVTVWVDETSQNPVSPFATEETAAKTLSAAAEAADALAMAGDTAVVVKVKTGSYDISREISVGYGIRYESVSGPAVTTVNQTETDNRAFCVTNGIVSGFTIHGVGCTTGTVNSGFQSSNGYAVLVYSTVSKKAAVVTNCVVEGFVSTARAKSNPSLYGGTVFVQENLSRFVDCIVRNNETTSPGAGVFLRNSGWVVNCVITNNAITSTDMDGAGLMFYGSGRLVNSLVAWNQSKSSYPGVYGNFWTGSGLILNCTIVSNATTKAEVCSGLGVGNTLNIPVYNTIVCGNMSGGVVGQQYTYVEGKTVIHNCLLDVEPTNAFENVGNVCGVDPLFVDPSKGDFRLAEGSRGIDEGVAHESQVSTDLGRRSRVVDGKQSGTAVIDIGCYEFDPYLDGAVLSARRTTDKYVLAGSASSFAAGLTCFGEAVSDATYTWEFGDGCRETAVGKSVASHVYSAPGVYSVLVTAVKGGFVKSVVLKDSVYVFAAGERTLWVTPNGEHASDFDSPTNAVKAAKSLIDGGVRHVTIVVAPGSYKVLTPIALNGAISLIGAEGPEKTIFSGSTEVGITMITMTSDEALFAGIAIDKIQVTWSNRGTSACGVNMTKGTVSNCVIRGISSIWSWQVPSHGCALTMSGGRAVEVVISNNVSKADECMRNGSAVKLSGTALMDRCRVCGNYGSIPYSAWLSNRYNRKDGLAGGGVYLASGTPICRNTLIAGNRTQSQPGAGAYVVAGTLENCTVVGNYMSSSTNAAWSSGIYAWSDAKIVNCISDSNMNGEASINAGGEEGIDASTVFQHSCLPGYGLGGVGCTTADPLLDADYKPAASEVLGKGKNAAWMDTACDLDGNPRKQGSRVDMGCYESDATVSGLLLIVR